jgi:hypothetical protein
MPIQPPAAIGPPSAATSSKAGADAHDITPATWIPTAESGGASAASAVEPAHYVRKLPAPSENR